MDLSGLLLQPVPTELWLKILGDRLQLYDAVKKGWILEGFPETREQAQALQVSGIYPKHCSKSLKLKAIVSINSIIVWNRQKREEQIHRMCEREVGSGGGGGGMERNLEGEKRDSEKQDVKSFFLKEGKTSFKEFIVTLRIDKKIMFNI